MKNPAELVPRPRGLLAAVVAIALVPIYFWSRSPDLMAGFRDAFKSLDAPITPLAEFVLRLPNIWAIMSLPAVALLIWVLARPVVARRELRNMKIAFVATLIFDGLFYAFVLHVVMSRFAALGSTV